MQGAAACGADPPADAHRGLPSSARRTRSRTPAPNTRLLLYPTIISCLLVLSQGALQAAFDYKCFYFNQFSAAKFDEAAAACRTIYAGSLVTLERRYARRNAEAFSSSRIAMPLANCHCSTRRSDNAALTTFLVQLQVTAHSWIGLRKYAGANALANYKWIARNTSASYSNFDFSIGECSLTARR